MSFMFYEVWAVDGDGHEELVHTTSSRSEAMKTANQAIEENEQYLEVYISEENENGDLVEITRFYSSEDKRQIDEPNTQ